MVAVPAAAVGAVGIPANWGLFVTNAVVAICVFAVPAAAVGAVGTPVNCGLVLTKAVVAICVLAVPMGAVGAVETPVKTALTNESSTYCCEANGVQVLLESYMLSTSVSLLYHSCPSIGFSGAVLRAKFSSKNT